MSPSYEEMKGLLVNLLSHDRWNSGVSDERLAEKIAVKLDGLISSPRSAQAHEL